MGDGECRATCCEPPYTEVFPKRGADVGLPLGRRAAQLHHLQTTTSVFRRPFAKVDALSITKLPADSSRDLGIMRPDVPPRTPNRIPRTSVHAAERSIGGVGRAQITASAKFVELTIALVTESGKRGPSTRRGPPDAR